MKIVRRLFTTKIIYTTVTHSEWTQRRGTLHGTFTVFTCTWRWAAPTIEEYILFGVTGWSMVCGDKQRVGNRFKRGEMNQIDIKPFALSEEHDTWHVDQIRYNIHYVFLFDSYDSCLCVTFSVGTCFYFIASGFVFVSALLSPVCTTADCLCVQKLPCSPVRWWENVRTYHIDYQWGWHQQSTARNQVRVQHKNLMRSGNQ